MNFPRSTYHALFACMNKAFHRISFQHRDIVIMKTSLLYAQSESLGAHEISYVSNKRVAKPRGWQSTGVENHKGWLSTEWVCTLINGVVVAIVTTSPLYTKRLTLLSSHC